MRESRTAKVNCSVNRLRGSSHGRDERLHLAADPQGDGQIGGVGSVGKAVHFDAALAVAQIFHQQLGRLGPFVVLPLLANPEVGEVMQQDEQRNPGHNRAAATGALP